MLFCELRAGVLFGRWCDWSMRMLGRVSRTRSSGGLTFWGFGCPAQCRLRSFLTSYSSVLSLNITHSNLLYFTLSKLTLSKHQTAKSLYFLVIYLIIVGVRFLLSFPIHQISLQLPEHLNPFQLLLTIFPNILLYSFFNIDIFLYKFGSAETDRKTKNICEYGVKDESFETD